MQGTIIDQVFTNSININIFITIYNISNVNFTYDII